MSFAQVSNLFNNIITRSNDLLCRSNKLFILFKRVIYIKMNNLFERHKSFKKHKKRKENVPSGVPYVLADI